MIAVLDYDADALVEVLFIRSGRLIGEERFTLEGAGDDDALKAARTRYTRLNQEYARFSKAAGLRTQTARLKAAGFSYKQGREAVKGSD